MSSFFRSNWVFTFIGFTVVLLAVLGYLIFQRLEALDTTPQPTSPDQTEISFTLDQLSPAPVEIPSCTALSASPDDGAAPLSVMFTANAIGEPEETLSYIFSFGDDKTETAEQIVTTADGQDTLTLSHTYSTPGNYTVFVTVEDSTTISRTVCETQVTVNGVATAEQSDPATTGSTTTAPTGSQVSITPTRTPTRTNSPTPSVPSGQGGPASTTDTTGTTAPAETNLTPTTAQLAQAAITPSPTRRPSTPTPTRRPATPTQVFPTTVDDESIPVPNVPRAGGFEPTAAAMVGGLAIVMIAILTKKSPF